VTVGVSVAAEDVDETLLVHAGDNGTNEARDESHAYSRDLDGRVRAGCSFCDRGDPQDRRKVQRGMAACASG
jgi:hypothetical protein